MGEGAACRPLQTFTASGRSGSYGAVSCRPGYFKSEWLHPRLPAGRIRPRLCKNQKSQRSLVRASHSKPDNSVDRQRPIGSVSRHVFPR